LFQIYADDGDFSGMSRLLALAVQESLQRRLAYLRGDKIVTLASNARDAGLSVNAQLNAARRQTIPAFRERGVWMIDQSQD
jgi:hypothetical protein